MQCNPSETEFGSSFFGIIASFVFVDTQWVELWSGLFFFETQIFDARNSWTRKIYCKVKFESIVVPQSLLDSTTCPLLEHIQTRRVGMRADRVGLWYNSKRSPSECSTQTNRSTGTPSTPTIYSTGCHNP